MKPAVALPDAPTLARDAVEGAISHVLGGVEVVALRDGTLYRVCTRDEAEAYYPRRRLDLPERPMRRVKLVDVNP